MVNGILIHKDTINVLTEVVIYVRSVQPFHQGFRIRVLVMRK